MTDKEIMQLWNKSLVPGIDKSIKSFARALLAASTASDKQDMLPQALWIRRGSGTSEWWSYKGYEARKDAAEQWVLRRAGIELYRHTYLQVVMAHAERAIIAAAPNPSDKQEAVCEHEWEAMTEPHKECVKCGDVRRDWSAAPPAQSAEQDRIDADLCFLDDDEITEAASKFRLNNPRFDTLRCFVNYVIIVAQHKGASK